MRVFTVGSPKDLVAGLHGTPEEVENYGSRDVWRYGSSSIGFKEGKVDEWNNDGGNLKVSFEPKRQTSDLTHFTVGSTMDEVLQLHGTPDIVCDFSSRETWWYRPKGLIGSLLGESSSISFKNGKVDEWNNNGGNLKVSFEPKRQTFDLTHFTVGSTMDEVLQLHGTPDKVYNFGSRETWWYRPKGLIGSLLGESSSISFNEGKVEGWNNGGNNLKIALGLTQAKSLVA